MRSEVGCPRRRLRKNSSTVRWYERIRDCRRSQLPVGRLRSARFRKQSSPIGRKTLPGSGSPSRRPQRLPRRLDRSSSPGWSRPHPGRAGDQRVVHAGMPARRSSTRWVSGSPTRRKPVEPAQVSAHTNAPQTPPRARGVRKRVMSEPRCLPRRGGESVPAQVGRSGAWRPWLVFRRSHSRCRAAGPVLRGLRVPPLPMQPTPDRVMRSRRIACPPSDALVSAPAAARDVAAGADPDLTPRAGSSTCGPSGRPSFRSPSPGRRRCGSGSRPRRARR